REALGDAMDHVVDERAHEAVPGAAGPAVVLPGRHHLVTLDLDRDVLGHGARKLALGAFDRHFAVLDRHRDALGDQDRFLADARHYQISQMPCPPTPCWRASGWVMMLWEVVGRATPRPERTLGMPSWATYMRCRGRDTRRRPSMAARCCAS